MTVPNDTPVVSDRESARATEENTDQFVARMAGAIDSACVTVLVSIGHQTGLFDTLAELPPATSAQIAQAAGLNERYVREWLGGAAAGGIVDYDPARGTYVLPEHRAAVLTRAAGPKNLARMAQMIPMMGEVEQKIITCFRNGGGLPYTEYPRFHAMMAEQSGAVFDAVLIDEILPLADDLPQRLRAGLDVADFACGSGHAVNVMAQEFPASRFTGVDFSEEAVAAAAAEATRLGLANARFERRDLAELDRAEAYDLITVFDAIHDQAQPARVLANIHRALRPGGVFLMADIKASSRLEDNIGLPFSPFLYTISTMHCMTVSLAHGGAGLGTVWGQQLALSMLEEAGFAGVRTAEVEDDPLNIYYIAHKHSVPLPAGRNRAAGG
ncbi:MAG: methyltransferase domain-containing protein [Mycobacterium sp.]|uniref:class I SAM-dependent methyltransferase n=1 Tax=Mycobacterium sp. TaxID=1785 RepID=UPI0026119807|nr:methyltransferase domain-containing protein [Mycobacterium sp.]MDI3312764.1 methyltransferase domain-containing protein [Mycobacterium sp.]